MPEPVHSAEQPWPSPLRAWYALSVLMVVLMLAILDRQIITLLVEPIKNDLGIDDTRMSLLMGFAFVTFYVVVGIPIARLSDRKSRRLIIGTGLVVWSVMTAACGLARTGWQLYLARVGVGVGEACNGPASYSLLSDYFPKEKLARALSVFGIGFLVGAALANIIGGWVIAFASQWQELSVPLIGSLRPWQLAFILVGLPGLAAAVLVATVREPGRRGLLPRGQEAAKHETLPLAELFRFLWINRQTYGTLYAGLASRQMVTIGGAIWLPTFFIRTYNWRPEEVGLAIGTVQLTIAMAGLLAGGFLAEWYAKKGYHDANLRVTLISTAAIVPTTVLYPLMPTPWLALGLFAVNSFTSSLTPGPANAAFQSITPNQLRAQVAAISLLLFNVIGAGVGPLLIAFLTDHLFGDDGALRYSLALSAGILAPLACLIFWYGLKPYRECVIRAKEWG